MKNPIWLLSGFLGEENHWGDFPAFLAHHLGVHPTWMNWFSETSGAQSLEQAAHFLAQRAYAEGLRPVLIGYSLGGRLALQCAVSSPGAFSGVFALSAHPGLTDEAAKNTRRKEDQDWAQLLIENSALFWEKWNQRDALKGSPIPEAPPLSESKAWSEVLVRLSTAEQAYFPTELTHPRLPVSVVSGEQDTKFTELMHLFPNSIEKFVLPQAGHRVPLDAPEELARLLAGPIRRTQEIL